uniref:Glycoprotein n=1 Tax=Spring viremia of carp virus TaxID=696863 RepID=G8XP25_SVCV|nr:glycoprotein [Sprivivirus cyprinus]ABV45196.1 glycoprotein [Sprivivirus cyprinus]
MSIISYIAFLLLIDSNLGIPIFVPSGRNISWQPVIQSFDYQCPIHGNLPNTMGLSTTKLTIKSPSVFSTDKVSGWICHAAEWKTTCDYRWYGPQYITHSIHPISPTVDECRKIIQRVASGTDEDLGFPPQSCGWASVTTVSNTNYKVVPHFVHLEPYGGHWIDHEFNGGECREKVCEMKGNHSIWITDETVQHECAKHIEEVEGIMYGNAPRGDAIYVNNFIIDRHHRVYRFGGSCQMKFCDKDGIKFARGDWVEKTAGTLTTIYNNIPRCVDGTLVTGHRPGLDLIDTVFNLENVVEYTLCEGTKRKINKQEKLTSVDLSYLAPRIGGFGSVFRVRNGTLERGSTTYIRIEVEGPIVDSLNGTDPKTNTSRVFWDDWELDGNIYQGFNGVYKGKDGKVHIPLNMIESGIIDDELQHAFQADIIPHPHYDDDEIREDDIFFDNTGENGNPVDAVVEWVSGWGTSLKFFGMTLVALILIFLLIRCCVACTYLVRRNKRPATESHEMRSLV